MATRIPFSAGGLDGAFTGLVGTVIGTDQRSDSYTYGGGTTTSVGSQVVGRTTVRTDVVVHRDIWLRDAEGQEHHRRLNIDLPVRVGQRFAFIGYDGAVRAGKRHVTIEMRISNLSTGKYHEVNPTKFLVKVLSYGLAGELPPIVVLAWGASFILCFFYGIGLLGVALLGLRYKKDSEVRLANDKAIRTTVEEKFQDMLALVDAEGARLAPPPEAPAGPMLQSGTA